MDDHSSNQLEEQTRRQDHWQVDAGGPRCTNESRMSLPVNRRRQRSPRSTQCTRSTASTPTHEGRRLHVVKHHRTHTIYLAASPPASTAPPEHLPGRAVAVSRQISPSPIVSRPTSASAPSATLPGLSPSASAAYCVQDIRGLKSRSPNTVDRTTSSLPPPQHRPSAIASNLYNIDDPRAAETIRFFESLHNIAATRDPTSQPRRKIALILVPVSRQRR